MSIINNKALEAQLTTDTLICQDLSLRTDTPFMWVQEQRRISHVL